MQAIGKGTVMLEMNISDNKNIACKLLDMLLVPQLSYILLSVLEATRNEKKFEFEGLKCYIMDAKYGAIGIATKYGNLYHLNCNGLKYNKNHTAMKCNGDTRTKENIWHRRYGHLGAQNLERLVRDKFVQRFDYDATENHALIKTKQNTVSKDRGRTI